MERAAVLRRLSWRAVSVAEARNETPFARTLVLDEQDWPGHVAGQHVDIRLTAEDGYQATRSYSVASAPGEPVELTVERVPDGEVSPFLVDDVDVGDAFELRGPVGGYFVWEPGQDRPALLVAGGSGVVPLRAMLRHRLRAEDATPMRLLYSARTEAHLIYRAELEDARAAGVDVRFTLTRSAPPGWPGYSGRVDDAMLGEVSWPADLEPVTYVCGPTNFVEATADRLVAMGNDPSAIKTERFG